MRFFPAIALIGLLSVPGLAEAKGKKHEPRAKGAKPKAAHVAPPPSRAPAPGPVRYLGGHPIGPLAVAEPGKVTTPVASACRTWGARGSRWAELDAYGKPVGEVVVTGGERYDATHCDELAVRRVKGAAGAGVYVAAASAPAAPSPFEASRLGETIREDLDRVVAPIEKTVAEIPGEARRPARHVLVFRDTRSGARYAVVGGRALVVARWDGSRWIVEHVEKPADKKARADAFRPRAVVDMTHDGSPSVVVHVVEGGGEFYGDVTLVRGKDGKWKSVAAGIHGSTA